MLKIKKMLKSKDFKTSLTFSIIGLIASVFLGVYQTSTFTESMEQQIISQLGSTHALILVAAIQGCNCQVELCTFCQITLCTFVT